MEKAATSEKQSRFRFLNSGIIGSKPRRSAGCWTCRVRRKKCDETRPICVECAGLEIDCVYSDAKPAWMDNGERQREMAERLKAKVKNRAAWRREKRFLQVIENGTANIDLAAGVHGGPILATTTASTTPASTAPSETAIAPSAPPPSEAPLTAPSTVPATNSVAASPLSPVSGNSHSSPSIATPLDDSGTDCSPQQPADRVEAPMEGFNSLDSHPLRATQWEPLVASMDEPSLDHERETNFLMMYLDYVFPFLFPSYHPSLLVGGRGWLLVILMKNKAVFHSALCLASYFFNVVVQSSAKTTGRALCQNHIVGELQRQQALSLRQLQRDLSEINHHGVAAYLAQSTQVMESIIQLIYFEVIISQPDSWCVHLDGALALFEQIMEAHGVVASSQDSNTSSGVVTKHYSWEAVLSRLSPQRTRVVAQFPNETVPYTSEQIAFKFFTTVLLYLDVVASSVEGKPSRLRKFHSELLMPRSVTVAGEVVDHRCSQVQPVPSLSNPDPVGAPQLHVAEVTGIQNWVIMTLSDITALAVWKNEAAAARRLSIMELIQRASPIEAELRGRLDCLAARVAEKGWFGGGMRSEEIPGFFSQYLSAAENEMKESRHVADHGAGSAETHSGSGGSSHSSHVDDLTKLCTDAISLIWGHAVLSYLLVVVNGWQPACDSIHRNVTRTMELIASLPSASCLRAVTWPYCVTGCLASRSQEMVFRGMVNEICGADAFGSVKGALGVMSEVWVQRDAIESGAVEWDMAKCFNILGRRPFLA